MQDRLYNHGAQKGHIYDRLKYLKTKKRPVTEQRDDTIGVPAGTDEITREIDELATYFSECVVANDKASIKDKLRSSATARQYDVLHGKKISAQILKLYAASPDLVGIENIYIRMCICKCSSVFNYTFCEI